MEHFEELLHSNLFSSGIVSKGPYCCQTHIRDCFTWKKFFGRFRPLPAEIGRQKFRTFSSKFFEVLKYYYKHPIKFFLMIWGHQNCWYFWLRKFQTHNWVFVRNTCQLFFESFLVPWRIRTYHLDIVSWDVFVSSCVILSIPLVFLPLVRIDSNYLLQVTSCIAIISWLSITLRSCFFCMILCGLVKQTCSLFGFVMTVWEYKH